MPSKKPLAAPDDFDLIRTADGHKARRRDYDDLSPEEAYEAIDERRNVHRPTVPPSEDD